MLRVSLTNGNGGDTWTDITVQERLRVFFSAIYYLLREGNWSADKPQCWLNLNLAYSSRTVLAPATLESGKSSCSLRGLGHIGIFLFNVSVDMSILSLNILNWKADFFFDSLFYWAEEAVLQASSGKGSREPTSRKTFDR